MTETITTPVGRLVQGSLYKGNDKDMDGNQLLYKSGPKTGEPRTDFYFAVAIPKEKETHWNQTSWGKVIEDVAKAAFPKSWNRHDFSWKIIDGDSTVMNKANRRPCDKEGFPGTWVVSFNRVYAPKIYNKDGSQQLFAENHVNLGDYVQVHATVAGNKSDKTPGVFINHLMVAFSGYGERIEQGADPESVGFGQSPLPPGVSSTPLAAFSPPVESPTTQPSAAVPPPYPAILKPPVVRTMLPAANGLSYEQYIAAGWTDEQMVEHGIMSM